MLNKNTLNTCENEESSRFFCILEKLQKSMMVKLMQVYTTVKSSDRTEGSQFLVE